MIQDLFELHKDAFSTRLSSANKGTYGRLLIIAGSRGMAGAAYLSGLAAFRMGIGMVKYFGPEANRMILQTLLPEAMYESMEPMPSGGEHPASGCSSGAGASHEAADCGRLIKSISWADSVILGPGLSQSDEASALLDLIFSEKVIAELKKKRFIVIDADALNLIAAKKINFLKLTGDPEKTCCGRETNPEYGRSAQTSGRDYDSNPCVAITPHIMEMVRLWNAGTGADTDACTDRISVGELKENPQYYAAAYAKKHNVQVILKDAVTTVALTDGRTVPVSSGCAAMAKAGSGDVLTGFIAGTEALLHAADSVKPAGADHYAIGDAVILGVWLHGRAGSIAAEKTGCHSLLARDIAEAAGKAMCVE